MNTADLITKWISELNKHSVDGIATLFSEDAIIEEVPESEPRIGKTKITEGYREFFRAYPDCRAEIVNQIIKQDQAAVEIKFMGTNTGEYRGTPASNQAIDLRIGYILKMKNGKIAHITAYYDRATILIQKGIRTLIPYYSYMG